MNLWDIVKTVGTGVISNFVPGGAAIISTINAFLPAAKKLPVNATGHQAADAIQSLPPADRAEIMERQFDVDITQIKETNQTARAMLVAEANSQHTTRPYIAKGSFLVIAFTIISIVSVWIVSVYTEANATVKAVMDGWPFVLAVLAPLVTLLHAYFGVLHKEHKHKLEAASGGIKPSGIAGLVASLMSKP